MRVRIPLAAVTVVLFLSPAQLLAGGLPRLCLPVNGVTADNANACVKRVADALGAKGENVEVRENGKQWYVLFNYNGGPLALGDLDAAFKGSPFSIPRDNLRLFGYMTLEVEVGEAEVPKLLADLKAVKHLLVVESKWDMGVLVVRVAAPIPKHHGRETLEFGKLPVEKELFGTDPSDRTPGYDPPAAARDLPTHDGLRAVVEKHTGRLKEVRWQCVGCSVQGGVCVPPEK